MIDPRRIERIIEAGVRAPSGDNSQPWSFKIEPDAVRICAHPKRDHMILNIDGRGTLLATGALIENMLIAAEHDGLHANVELFPDGHTALIKFSSVSSRGHRLYEALFARHTNRTPFDTKRDVSLGPITATMEKNCRISIITEPSAIKLIADDVSMMEEAALSTKKLHRLFFDSILWSAEDNNSGASGLYILAMELPPPVRILFRVITYWPVQWLLNVFKFPKAAAAANAAVYEQSAAIVTIIVSNFAPEYFIAAGRCMERVWLEATTAGLAVQPLAGLLYLAEYLERTRDKDFSEDLRKHVFSRRKDIEKIVGAKHGEIAMLMRIGYPTVSASARAGRRKPQYI